ncbi:MAG TPA: cyclic nucleotide-binding domain-containing protein, partial [Burkholderiaceae bacterium]|nr:cyclic nucleotide-binding domain-containing protein [Burkholderiaceae bacterium]
MYALEIVEHAVATATAALARPEGRVALASAGLAGALILAGSFVKTMIPLRWLGLGSNLGFIVYGALYPQLPMLVLHSLLVPVNLYRLIEMIRLTRRVNAAAQAKDTSGLWLRPYMKRRKLKAGTVLFRKGDEADHLYMLASGRIELVEIGTELPAGRTFGEIAFFAPDRQRTATARCIEDSEVLAINESTVRQLYYQNPDFGFQLIGLVAGRLIADNRRLQATLEAQRA